MRDDRTWLWRGLLVMIVGANTYFELSSSFGKWFGRSADSESLPEVVRDVMDARPESDADLHGLMWFVAAVVMLAIVRRWPLRIPALGALLLYTGLVELLQKLTPARAAQWVDMLGNAIGISAAGVVVALWERRRRSRASANVLDPSATESSMATQ